MPYIAILTDGKSWAFVKSTGRKRKRRLTKRFSEAKRFSGSDVEFYQAAIGRFIAIRGALLEFHKVKR